jgi:hypothetical protein
MDRTDAGLYWDIRQNYRAFIFDSTNGQFALPSAASMLATILGEAEQPDEGVEWLTYTGYWGNEQYARSDPRQVCVFGHCRYSSGPNGKPIPLIGGVRKQLLTNSNRAISQEPRSKRRMSSRGRMQCTAEFVA